MPFFTRRIVKETTVMLARTLGIVAATMMCAACSTSIGSPQTVQKQLKVWGSEAGMERFVSLQKSRRPALTVSASTMNSDGRASATVALPATYTGKELVHTTREALAAGLWYEYQEVRSTTRKSS